MAKKDILIGDLVSYFDKKYDIGCQLQYDNSGFQIGDKNESITSIVLTLDVTNAAIELAIQNKANLIISHHPLFFNAVKNMDYIQPQTTYIRKLIENKIAVYSMHTNYDIKGELREYLADIIGGSINKKYSNDELVVCDIKNEIFENIANKLQKNNIMILHGRRTKSVYNRIAYINGSGGRNEDIANELMYFDVDLFITAEMKHSFAIKLIDMDIDFIELNHAQMEKSFIKLLKKDLIKYINVNIYENNEEVYNF